MDKAMKDALIERAARAMCVRNGEDPDTLNRTGIMWKYYWDRAEAALEATGVFDLVEAIEGLGAMPGGYCYCFGHKRDPLKTEPHTGECAAIGAALTAAFTIDRPAPVVVKTAIEKLVEAAVCAGHDGSAWDGPESTANLDFVMKTTDAVLSAVNAVSEAQVRADERERLAKLAESVGWVAIDQTDPANGDVNEVLLATWLRAQEGGASR